MDITLFTAAMRGEFLKAMQAVAKPAPIDAFTTVVPSTARIENYAWMTPSPGISRYIGHRRYATLDQIRYTVPNLEFDGSISVALRDADYLVEHVPIILDVLHGAGAPLPDLAAIMREASADPEIPRSAEWTAAALRLAAWADGVAK